jgi:hypothetical protein
LVSFIMPLLLSAGESFMPYRPLCPPNDRNKARGQLTFAKIRQAYSASP